MIVTRMGLLILTLTLIFLKVTNFVTFGWVWCFAPIWIPFGLMVVSFTLRNLFLGR